MSEPTDNIAAWPPLCIGALLIRRAAQADAATLTRWDAEPSVIACTTDDPNAVEAFHDAEWTEEIAAASPSSAYFIAEVDGRPIGAMLVIDPHLEPTRYWGDVGPNLRAIDIWIGDAADRSKGHGAAMMRAVLDRCFADPAVMAIIIDPLASNTRAHVFYERMGFRPVGRQVLGGEDLCLVHRLERADWEKWRQEGGAP